MSPHLLVSGPSLRQKKKMDPFLAPRQQTAIANDAIESNKGSAILLLKKIAFEILYLYVAVHLETLSHREQN